MAGMYYKGISRRRFIKASFGTVAAFVSLGSAGCQDGASVFGGKGSTRWAFISDIHIPKDVENNYNNGYPYKNFKKVVPQLIDNGPDSVLITGDIARLEGKVGDYENLKGLLKPLAERAPVFMALGNHDDFDNFNKVFPSTPGERQAVEKKHVTVVESGPVRFILLDSLMSVNKAPGLLGETQRQWLGDFLADSDDRPTLICFHHMVDGSDIGLRDTEQLFEIIEPHKKVKAVVYGHSHRYVFSKRGNIDLINLPATSYVFSKTEPLGWVEAVLTAKGGAFTLKAFDGDLTRNGETVELEWRI